MNVSTAFIDFFAKIGKILLTIHEVNTFLRKKYFSFHLGWAYDLKTVSEEVIRKRAARTGDGSTKYSKCIVPNGRDANNNDVTHKAHKHSLDENLIWGWDDEDMCVSEKKTAIIINKNSSD